MRIREITLYRADLPLITPYKLSYNTFETFEPIIVEVRDEDGGIGWGEQHISPGSSAETRDGGWAFATEMAAAVVGLDSIKAKNAISAETARSKVAATALVTAIEMLNRCGVLECDVDRRFRLLTAFNASDRDGIKEEVERRLDEGFKTFKIKVGQDVDADIKRFAWIQECVNGRATLRVDANRGFNREQGRLFASSIDPAGVELFEQPCPAEDWDANAAVAEVSNVPLMLDEPICTLADIDRAATIDGVGLCKVKLKRFGSIKQLREAIVRIKSHGMTAVLGDGLGAEINSWMEARAADTLIDNAGEFNGFVKIKPEHRLLETPLPFKDGEIIIPGNWWPVMDRARLQDDCLQTERFAPTSVRAAKAI